MPTACEQVAAEIRLTIERELERLRARGLKPRRLLDVGCWDGATTERYARIFGCPALGIEVFEPVAARARERGVEVARLDLEGGSFPWSDGSVDVVVVNQVFEHLKDVWRPMSEIHRVLSVDGAAVLSVPNLGSLHNRVLLAAGRQPTSIRTLGPHVRGFTFGEFGRFVALDGALEVERALGVGFYPLPARLSGLPATVWRGAAHTTLLVARKRRAGPSPWLEYLRREQERGLQTHFG